MAIFEIAWRFYLIIALTMAIYSFCLCGVPEIQRRRVLKTFWAPLWAHTAAAVLIACVLGLVWPWVLWPASREEVLR